MIERLGLKASLVKFLKKFADKMFSFLMIRHLPVIFTAVYYPNGVVDQSSFYRVGYLAKGLNKCKRLLQNRFV
ncbi:MAG: hypothetical protein ACYS19_02500 [Planctomycetota bacterium]|jgi:hypothetical protein